MCKITSPKEVYLSMIPTHMRMHKIIIIFFFSYKIASLITPIF